MSKEIHMGGFGIAILFSLFSFIYLFFVAIAIGVILYLLYSYVFQSIASMCMLKNIGYVYPFTAWIPFYHKYLLGKIANKQILGAISGVLSFISICLCVHFYIHLDFDSVLFSILTISFMTTLIIETIIAHQIYKTHTKYADIFTIFTILSFGILKPIFLFIIRNMGI